MDAKKLLTGVGIVGGVLGGICSLLGIAQTVDQMKNGVKLRDDQLESLSNSVSIKVSANIVNNYDALAAAIVAQAKESKIII